MRVGVLSGKRIEHFLVFFRPKLFLCRLGSFLQMFFFLIFFCPSMFSSETSLIQFGISSIFGSFLNISPIFFKIISPFEFWVFLIFISFVDRKANF